MRLIYSNVFSVAFAKNPVRLIPSLKQGFLEYHFENREEAIMTKEKLLAVGDRFEARDCRKSQQDAAYR